MFSAFIDLRSSKWGSGFSNEEMLLREHKVSDT